MHETFIFRLGFRFGLRGRRNLLAMLAMLLLIAGVIVVIIDLDRP